MMTISEVSRKTGVSVRALRHYDAIGLLKPVQVTEAGYRLYDEAALKRLQLILLFRELQFPLKEIRAILDTPTFEPDAALQRQIRLLELQKARLEGLIALANRLQEKGFDAMDFHVFDRSHLEEAKARWGHTEAYREFAQRGSQDHSQPLMAVFADLGQLKHLPPQDPAVQAQVARLQTVITDHYYTCTKEILAGLGQMYIADDRFRRNIDNAGGDGTAQFAAEAIAVYCG